MASTSQTPSASASYSTPPAGWDVFLSFRGSDTRLNFTSHLYSALDRHGVGTFMDYPELTTGEDIGDVRIKAIRESKIYVVVLSENYASSSLCLDELAEIVECQKTMNRSIIGVYYNIDQSVVQHLTGSVGKALKKHEARARPRFLKKASTQHRAKMEKVNNWRLALTQVSGIPGETISAERSESDAIKKVVDKVLLLIQPMNLDVAKYPIGLDSRVTHVTELMNCYTEGVARIGIHGMGGIGKTTLAKAVYNKNCYYFQGSCFLENVREASVSKGGLVCLQQQLINDVLKCKNINVDNVDQGIELIRARLCSIKVLIVIDDLDDPRPLEFLEGPFALGSRIIITTRNEDLLDSIKVETKYKVNELGDTESRQLFTQHAFGERMPERFTELSQEILEHAGGLPLALEVFGLSVFNISEEELACVDNLKRVSFADVEKKLVLSFDALELVDPVLQDIFLDVACFFVGRNKEEVVKIMKTCYKFVNPSIDILIKRCLLTTNDRDELGMHNLIRDMGREIARNNFPDEPGKHSRLWVSKEICDVLNNHKGTEVIEGIVRRKGYNVDALNEESFTLETFKKMRKLRFLCLKKVKVHLTGSFEQTFEDLRWLCWDYCPLKCLPSEFYPPKLVILELRHSTIITMWELNMIPRVFEKLKTLDMSYSQVLATTPDFTNLPCLETLNFKACESLEEVHISIGCLVRLVSLDLRGCVKLRSFPDTICNLRALEVLDISDCSCLEALPTALGNIQSLRELNAKNLNVSKLPDSIGHLGKLVELRLSSNKNLETLPDTICNLRSLEILDISGCEKLEILVDQLCKVTSLRELIAGGATLLKISPHVESCQFALSLQILDLSDSVLTALPPGISQLSNLEDLNLKDCRCLLSIAELPRNLKWIKAERCMSMEILPNLSNLKQLEYLNLKDCTGLTEIQGLKRLASIRRLHLEGCNSSLLASIFTESFFEMYSEFGHPILISSTEFPDWISQSSEDGSTMSLNLPPNMSHNYLGMILCIRSSYVLTRYSVKNTTSDFVWRGSSDVCGVTSLMEIVPRSIFSVEDGDDRIELNTEPATIHGIHLLCKTEEHVSTSQ